MRGHVVATLVAALVLAWAAGLVAQERSPEEQQRVRDLLVLLDGPDPRSAQDGADELVRIGPSVRSEVVSFLRTRTGCRAQWLASSVLAKVGLEAALVETKWLGIAEGGCQIRRVSDSLVRQEAAYAVVDRARGIELMIELLRGRDLKGRHHAALALRRLTERLAPGHASVVEATPEIVGAIRDALPALRDTVQSTTPLDTRCAAFESLQRARDLPQEAIRARAREVADRLQLDCEAITGPLTEKERRQSWREVISRLDTQPPDLAARTTSALLANLAEARPHLEERLRGTDRCRGLTLVAGILASGNTATAAVEAAYVRVLEGKCDGREPFDLALAQSVADVFMRDAAGIARVTALLPHKDVAVRRRAAQAFATAFERLGPGEQGKAAGATDPAVVAPIQAALAPLVTLAQNERDETARCQAVRALLFAQQAVHDALRAEAAAATAGRTLRCLAPPPR